MEIGFERIMIQPFDTDGTPDGEIIVIEGNTNEGGALAADISGLSSDPVTKHASNKPYYVAQKGTGDVSVALSTLDIPPDEEARILGYKVNTAMKAQFIGEDTAPPYCAMILESETAQGEVALFGFFKGKFNRSEMSLKTKESGNFDPDGESFTYAAVTSSTSDATKGYTMLRFYGTEEEAEEIRDLVLMSTGG